MSSSFYCYLKVQYIYDYGTLVRADIAIIANRTIIYLLTLTNKWSVTLMFTLYSVRQSLVINNYIYWLLWFDCIFSPDINFVNLRKAINCAGIVFESLLWTFKFLIVENIPFLKNCFHFEFYMSFSYKEFYFILFFIFYWLNNCLSYGWHFCQSLFCL